MIRLGFESATTQTHSVLLAAAQGTRKPICFHSSHGIAPSLYETNAGLSLICLKRSGNMNQLVCKVLCLAVCRRPTFSEAKRVLYTLLSVFEPSSHALQALTAPSKPAAPKVPKPAPKKEEAASPVDPEPQPPKVQAARNLTMCNHDIGHLCLFAISCS